MIFLHRLTANTLSQLQKRTGPLEGALPQRQNVDATADTIMEMIQSLQNEIKVV